MDATTPATRAPQRDRLALAMLLAGALLLRLPWLTPDAFLHPDEAIQYLEQAHRLAFGYGVEPWDYRYGLRSWLLPLLLSLPMRLGAAIAPASALYLLLPRLCAMLASLAAVWAGWRLGCRVSRLHGWVAGAAMACWYEAIVFADHVLSEPLAAACLLAAAALIEGRARDRVIAGGLLALAAVFRLQYAPAAAVLALLALRGNVRGWRDLAIGAAPVLLAAALVDVAMAQTPFAWVFANLRLNLAEHRAARYGTLPPLAYLGMLVVRWGPLAAVAPLLIAPIARRWLPLLAAALVTLALHMAIGHKEYRFVWFAVQAPLLLCAIGSAELALRLLGNRITHPALALLLTFVWGALSAALAWQRPIAPYEPHFAARLAVTRIAGRLPGLCGVALLDTPYWSSGYAFLHRPLPLYLPWRADTAAAHADFARATPAFNGLIAPAGSAPARDHGYRPIACRGVGADRICVWRRPGGCDARVAPDLRIEAVLRREDS